MRGLQTLLIEKQDLASGRSDVPAVFLGSLKFAGIRSSSYQQRIDELQKMEMVAPNWVNRHPVVYPIHERYSWSWGVRAHLSARGHAKAEGSKFFQLTGDQLREEVDAGFSNKVHRGVAFESASLDVRRFILGSVQSAVMYGAELALGATAVEVIKEKGIVTGIQLGSGDQLFAKVIIDTTAGDIRPIPTEYQHWLILRYPRSFFGGAQLLLGRFGAPIVIYPSGSGTIVTAPISEPVAQSSTLSRVIEDIAMILPEVSLYRASHFKVLTQVASVNWGQQVEQSAMGDIYHHKATGVRGLYSAYGGEYWAHRLLARRVTGRITRYLKKREGDRTHLEVLPNCSTDFSWIDISQKYGMNPLQVKRLFDRYGLAAREVLEVIDAEKWTKQTLCECQQVLAAEVLYVAKREWATELESVRRRTSFGEGACLAEKCAFRGACVLARASSKNTSHKETVYRANQFRYARLQEAVLRGEQIAQVQNNEANRC